MTRLSRVAVVLFWVMGLGMAALAHHSFDAEFDSNKPITITGVVTKLDWVNPHAYVYLDSKTRWARPTRWCAADGSATP